MRTPPAEASNMQIIGRSDLNGVGKGGEGLAIKQYPDGQRVLYLAHESGPMCVSVLDVTHPEQPTVITQFKVEADHVRCNSLGLAGNTLVVAHQTEKAGQSRRRAWIPTISPIRTHPKKLSHFDTSGPHSRGVHFVWFTDGHYAYLSTGARDFTPHNKNDDQFLMIVDVSDPRHPRGDRPLVAARHARRRQRTAAAACRAVRRRHPHALAGRARRSKPDRAYVGWIDGGWMILDIADKAHPKLVAHRSWQSVGQRLRPHRCFRSSAAVSRSRPRRQRRTTARTGRSATWVWDISDEKRPIPLAVLPPAADQAALCKAGGRFGAHNIHMNRPTETSRTLTQTVVGSYFNGGVRAYSIERPEPSGRDRLSDPAGAAAEHDAHDPDQ